MVATAPSATAAANAARARRRAAGDAPDLAHFRQNYPLTVTNLATLPRREEWLRRVWELDERWRAAAETRGGEARAEEVVVRGAPPRGAEVEAEFDIVYAGGTLGLLHAAVMACRYNRRVLVFDAHEVGRTHRDWNISDDELKEFERAGLFTAEELERAVANRYGRGGFVKFHDAASRVKAGPLWMSGVLDVAVEADRLLALAAAKVRREGPPGCQLLDGLRFVRAYVEPDGVTIEAEGRGAARRFFRARLFADATGTNSAVARQLNRARALTHVCPTVGTVATGFARGAERDEVDFDAGEILVSTEDASEHRQLIWEGFAGSPSKDEYTTYLFFYDAVESPADKSLLSLFERYFETLPAYKRRGAGWRVRKPVFGYIPSFHRRGWRDRKVTSGDRVLLLGDAAGLSSPLTFCGFGSHVRNLRRLTRLTELALRADATDAASLAEVNAYEPRVAQTASLAEFMRPTPRSKPAAVNETMNAVTAALHLLDEGVRRELFQDRLSFAALRRLLGQTARVYPRVFARVREHLGARGTLWWLADIYEALRSERGTSRAADPAAGEDEGEDSGGGFAPRAALHRNGNGAGGGNHPPPPPPPRPDQLRPNTPARSPPAESDLEFPVREVELVRLPVLVHDLDTRNAHAALQFPRRVGEVVLIQIDRERPADDDDRRFCVC
jgi:lycopene cyclase CruA